jgi:hypothetical protein
MPSAIERFWAKVLPEPNSGCWLWLGQLRDGYASLFVAGRPRSAHRLSYETHKGRIPDGRVLHHLCRTPSCVNPDHLEAVTSRTMIRRGDSPPGRLARQTHCLRGHLLGGDNLYVCRRGRRLCRACDRWRHERKTPRAARRGGEPTGVLSHDHAFDFDRCDRSDRQCG